jgi:hypothetical protein
MNFFIDLSKKRIGFNFRMDYLLFIGLLSAAIGMRWIVARYPYSGK